MKNKINELSALRKSADIQLQDLAYILNHDTGNLSKIENGVRDPSLQIILLYHMLFKASLPETYTELYAHLYAQIIERSQQLITNLERKQSPKSNYRIKAITKIVKSLNHDEYDDVN